MTEGDRTIKHAIPVLLIGLAVSGCAAAAADLSDAARDAFRKSVPERGVIRITLQAASTTGVGTTVRAFDFASGAWYSSGGTVGTGGRRADGTVFSGTGREGETKTVPPQPFHRTSDAEWMELVPAVTARMLLRDPELVVSEARTERGEFEVSFQLHGDHRPTFILTVDPSGVPIRVRTAEGEARAFDRALTPSPLSPQVPLVSSAGAEAISKVISSVEWLPAGTAADVSEEEGTRKSATLRVDDAKALAAITQGWTKDAQGDWVGPDAKALAATEVDSGWKRWSTTLGVAGVVVILVSGAVWWRKRARP